MTSKQTAFLQAMLEESTISKATAKAGITRKTAYNYMKNEDFQRELTRRRGECINDTVRYLQGKGITPSDSAICLELGLTSEQLKNLRKAISEASCISINDSPPDTDGLTYADILADPLDLEEQVLDTVVKEQAERLIWKIVSELEERQAAVLVGKYKESATLKEIGKRLNLSCERIRAIERKALSILRMKREIKDIAEIYGYRNAFVGTGLKAFKNRGFSSVEYTVMGGLV